MFLRLCAAVLAGVVIGVLWTAKACALGYPIPQPKGCVNFWDSSKALRIAKHHPHSTGPYLSDPHFVLFGLKSLSMHEARGSKQDRDAPTFCQDLESLDESLWEFDKGCSRELGIERHVTLGNHEYRADRAAENDPRHMSDAPTRLAEKFINRGWQVTPYQQWLFYSGVGFTHIPSNRMGRAVGGKNVGNTIANEATHSIVYGHNHIYEFKPVPKLGLRSQIQILGLGTAMPDGMTEKYTPQTSPTGWSYGVVEMMIDRLGNITDHRFVSMQELEKRYG